MQPLDTDVARSVCLLDTTMNPAKTAEPIEMPFGLLTRVGSRNQVLGGVQIPPGEGVILGVVLPRYRLTRVVPEGAIKRVCVYVCSAPLKMHCNSDSNENGCINYKIYIPTDSTWPETYTCIVCLHLHLRKKSSLKRRMHNSPHVNKQR